MRFYVEYLAITAFAWLSVAPAAAQSAAEPEGGAKIMIDDFESYPVGGLPTEWQFLSGRDLVPVSPAVMNERELFEIEEEDGNKFTRATTKDQAHRIIRANGNGFKWNLETHPRLRWRWRAVNLPEGAREDERDLNDTGAAVYVTFSTDWLGRPKSIKYTYSSTLPIGTVVSYGPLRVLVIASAAETSGKWMTADRDILADYRQLFGGDAPTEPLSITLWSDSDTIGTTAVADFDDIQLLPPFNFGGSR